MIHGRISQTVGLVTYLAEMNQNYAISCLLVLENGNLVKLGHVSKNLIFL
jgi:hypothetical protein